MITPVITLNTGPWEFKGTLTIEGSPRSRADRLCQRGRFPGRDLLGFPAGSSGRPTCRQQAASKRRTQRQDRRWLLLYSNHDGVIAPHVSSVNAHSECHSRDDHLDVP